MATKPQIGLRQTQRLALNPTLTASIRVLRSDTGGLARYLEEQAAANPCLRLDHVEPREWLPRWQWAFDRVAGGAEPDIHAAGSPSLSAHVMGEIDRLVAPAAQRRIAQHLADALEASGWLGGTLAEVARQARVSVAEVEPVLVRLQQMEPAGLFARSLAECLRLQARAAGELTPDMEAVLAHLDLLGRGDLVRLARVTGLDAARIQSVLRCIRGYDPKPGTQFSQGAAVVREPDLILRRGAGGWEISLNRSALPTVRVEEAPDGLRKAGGAWSQARSVQRMVEMRNQTLLRVAQEMLLRQAPALEAGCEAQVPMTMAEVARALDLHESTVSRVVAGASADTPLGTWWLRDLFSPGLGPDGGPPSAAAVRSRMERMIGAEPRDRPLSDEALVAALAGEGVRLARRTVAKYREMLNIPPAHRRKRRG